MDQNACAECGFTTVDLGEFTRHVDRHERGGGAQRKQSSGSGTGTGQQMMPMRTTNNDGEMDNGTTNAEFQRLLDLALSASSPSPSRPSSLTPALSATGDRDQSPLGRIGQPAMLGQQLADLSRFLSAAVPVSHSRLHSPAALSPLSAASNSAGADGNSPIPPTAEDSSGEGPVEERTEKKASGKKGKGGGGGKQLHCCPHCTFTTCMSQHMKSHLRAHDNFVGQMYICDVCGMAFSQKANMHRHRGTHSGVKPYECRFCQKRFFRKDQMQEHSMTHIKTGDDFDCPVSGCESNFTQHQLLRQHLDDRHAVSPTRQAHCKKCTLQFSNSRRLLLHYQTKHNQYYSGSPVPDGQSPVKRLLLDGDGGQPCRHSAASSPNEGEGEEHNQEDGNANSQSSSAAAGAGKTTKTRKSRKRGRQQWAGDGHQEQPKVLARPSHGHKQGPPQRAVPSTAANPAYKVEELLKLDCAGSGPNAERGGREQTVANAIAQQSAAAAALFSIPSPLSGASPLPLPSGMDMFRDHLLRACPSSAPLLPLFAGHHTGPKEHHQQQHQAVVAAAQLFMQSLLMQQQQQGTMGGGLTMSPAVVGGGQQMDNAGAEGADERRRKRKTAGGGGEQESKRPNPKSKSNDHPVSQLEQGKRDKCTPARAVAGQKQFLPDCRSPDCKGLMLNGFKTVESRVAEETHRENEKSSQCQSQSSGTPPPALDNGEEEQEGEEEGRMNVDEDGGSEEEEEGEHMEERGTGAGEEAGQGERKEETKEEEKGRERTEEGDKDKARQQPQPTAGGSGHSSTTHSPSSSSTSSKSHCAGGSGTASSVPPDNSPLKLLNGKLLSSAMLSRALLASEGLLKEGLDSSGGQMDCAHCGLMFSDQTLYLLHKGLHSEADPWRCNLCGQSCLDKYTFTTHIVSSDHS